MNKKTLILGGSALALGSSFFSSKILSNVVIPIVKKVGLPVLKFVVIGLLKRFVPIILHSLWRIAKGWFERKLAF